MERIQQEEDTYNSYIVINKPKKYHCVHEVDINRSFIQTVISEESLMVCLPPGLDSWTSDCQYILPAREIVHQPKIRSKSTQKK